MNPLLFRITKVFRETLGIDDLVLNEAMSPADIEEWDSVAQVQLFLALEEEFDVSFTPDELASIARVGDMVRLLELHGISDV